MPWKLTVTAVDKTTSIDQAAGVTISLQDNERSTFRFRTAHGYLPALRAEVVIYDTDGTTAIVGGIIFSRASVGIGNLLKTDCDCAGWAWYFDNTTMPGAVITGTYTLLEVLQWIQTNILAARGFTLDPAQVTGPSWTVTGYAWERKTLSAFLRDNVGPASQGYVFFTTPLKVWGMKKANLAVATAPFSISDGSNTARDLQWKETTQHYVEKVILPYGDALTPAEVTAGSGLIERILPTATDITVTATAQAQVDGYLVMLNQQPRTFQVSTLTAGLRPGQVLDINSTIRSAVAKALITRVTITLVTNTFWRYEAEAIAGVYQGSSLDAFRGGGSGGGGGMSGIIVSAPPSGEALTRVDDTNLTLTLGGSPTTALLAATSITAGWAGTLAAPRGGTGFGSYAVGDLLYASTTSALAKLADVAAGRYLRSGGVSTAPLWSTLVLPNTATVGRLAVATATDTIGELAAGSLGQIVRSAGAGVVPTWSTATYPATVTANRVLYGTGANVVGESANLTFNGTTLGVTGDATISGTLGVTGVSTFIDNIVLTANGNPAINYTSNLGSLSLKYLTLHAAELWVETLVAQNTIATIGGRILVGPTTTLTVDLASGGTTITVKHNQMAVGDRAYMEADGKLEFFAILTGPTGTGPYTYTVTRNLDGTGANQWYAGDAMFNTGTTGDGFIDMYSVSGVVTGGLGPTIVGNVRTGTTYSNIANRWAIGNLRNLYNYGASDVYGAAFGDPAAANLTIDATNGLRIRHGTTNKLQADISGNLWIGSAAGNRVYWDGTTLTVVSASVQIDSTGITLDPSTSGINTANGSYKFDSGDATIFGMAGWETASLRKVSLLSTAALTGKQAQVVARVNNTFWGSGITLELAAQGSAVDGDYESFAVALDSGPRIQLVTSSATTLAQFKIQEVPLVLDSAAGTITERARTVPLGEWIAVTFNAGNFTASGGGSWTVASGDLGLFRYMLVGKTMWMNLITALTTTSGTITALKVLIPGGATAASGSIQTVAGIFNGTVWMGGGVVETAAADTSLYLYLPTRANWPAVTDNIYVSFVAAFEIQ